MAYSAQCLQPPAKTLTFSILRDLMLRLTFSHFSESGQKRSSDHLVGDAAVTILKNTTRHRRFPHTFQKVQPANGHWTFLIQEKLTRWSEFCIAWNHFNNKTEL